MWGGDGDKAGQDDLIDKLTPAFCTREDAEEYMSEIRMAASHKMMPVITGKYKRSKRLRAQMSGKYVWQILYDAGIYPRKLANWNKQL